MKTDIEIANSIEIKPIYEIADKLGIDRDLLEPYGRIEPDRETSNCRTP